MSVKVNNNGTLKKIAGGTLYADAPIGTIQAYGGAVDSSHSAPLGWLLCDGSEVAKTSYAELYAVIGDAFGTASAATNFVLPDLREATTKGAGLTGKSNNHYDTDGLALGEFIDDRVQAHNHGLANNANFFITGSGGTLSTGGTAYGGANRTANNNGRSGDTTEVKAVGVNYIIKAKQVALPADLETQVEDIVDTKIAADKVSSIASGNAKSVTSGAVYSGLTDFVKVVDAVGTLTLEANSQKQVSLSFTCPAGYKAVLATPKSAGSWAFVWAFCYLASQSSVYAVIKSCLGADETQTIAATVLCVKTSF